MKRLLLPGTLLLSSLAAQAQTSVIVNPDGTHSVVHQSGSTATVVNPNGTHSVMHNADGAAPILVNADGTHSTVVRSGSTIVVVNPGGTHSVGQLPSSDTTGAVLRLLPSKKRKK